MDLDYAYIVGVIVIMAPFWGILFWLRKDLRQQMLTMSLLFVPFGPISEVLYLRDYWQPQYIFGSSFPLEDMLFAFFIAGLAAVAYEIIFTRTCSRRTEKAHKWLALLIASLSMIIIILGSILFQFNSIYVTSLAALFVGFSIIFIRHDLFRNAIVSGLLVGVFMLLAYLLFLLVFPDAITKWWMLKNISGILVLGIPVEELLWGFSWGFSAGPLYEFINGMRRVA